MADSTQLMALGKMLSGFGDLGMKGAFAFSEIEESKANAAWQDFVHKKAVIDFKLEQFTRQQEKVIKDRTMEMVTDGMQNMQYGGDPVKAMNAYNTLSDGLKNNPNFRQIIFSDPHAADAVTHFLQAGSGTLVDASRVKFPDGKGAPNFEIIKSGEKPFDRFQQLQIVAGRIPQYVTVTQADGKKVTVDQRAALYESQGFSLPMIHYDTVNGTATATEQEFVDNARAQKFAQDNPGVSYSDAKTILSLGVGSVQVGDKFLSPVDAFSAMRGGDAEVTKAYLRQSPDMKATYAGLSAAGIPVNPAMLESATVGKMEAVAATSYDPQTTVVKMLGPDNYKSVQPVIGKILQGFEGKDALKNWAAAKTELFDGLPGAEGLEGEWANIVNAKPEDRQQALANFAVRLNAKVSTDTIEIQNRTAQSMATVANAAGLGGSIDALVSDIRGANGPEKKSAALLALNTTTVSDPVTGAQVKAVDLIGNYASELKARAQKLEKYQPPLRDETGKAMNVTAQAQDMQTVVRIITQSTRQPERPRDTSGIFDQNVRLLREMQSDKGSIAKINEIGLARAAPDVAKNIVLEFAVAGNQVTRDVGNFLSFTRRYPQATGAWTAQKILGKGATSTDLYNWLNKIFYEVTTSPFGALGAPANMAAKYMIGSE